MPAAAKIVNRFSFFVKVHIVVTAVELAALAVGERYDMKRRGRWGKTERGK